MGLIELLSFCLKKLKAPSLKAGKVTLPPLQVEDTEKYVGFRIFICNELFYVFCGFLSCFTAAFDRVSRFF